MNYWIIFLTGLTTGGISCLAMQGGLLASVIANQKGDELEERGVSGRKDNKLDVLDWLPAGMFLLSKLVVHTIFGFLLGALGSVITLGLEVRLAFQIFTVLFMLATAMNLLEVHPVFRYVLIQPPRFVNKWIRNTTKSKALFAPMVLGAMTIFIPCGVTQAMEVLAINTGNPVMGALVMLSFVLGTSPLFAFVGVATAKLSEKWNKWFLQIAAVGLIFMSLYYLNGVLTVINFPITWQKITYVMMTPMTRVDDDSLVEVVDGVQKVTVEVKNNGYLPKSFTVKAGIPVEMTIKSDGVYSCALAFTFKQFKINEFLDPVDERVVRFTPTEKGMFTFSCSMGMYTGVMKVI